MLNTITNLFLKLVFKLCSILTSVICAPLYLVASAFFPNLDAYTSTVGSYFSSYIVPLLSFARAVFLNITGYPVALFTLLVTFFMARLAFNVVIHILRFLFNIYAIIRGSQTSSSVGSSNGS